MKLLQKQASTVLVMYVTSDGSVRPVAYTTRYLVPSEKNYAQINKEALVIVYAVKKFHKYIFGRKFNLVTDHAPLTSLLEEKKVVLSLAVILSTYD